MSKTSIKSITRTTATAPVCLLALALLLVASITLQELLLLLVSRTQTS